MSKKHKVFISFQHEDIKIKEKMERMFSKHFDIMDSRAVSTGDIDPNLNNDHILKIIRDKYLLDSSVTLVLIGENTYKSKFVDWEIHASLKDRGQIGRSGLLGIFIPGITNGCKNNKNLIPARLGDNIKFGYASCHEWTEDPNQLQEWIHEAFKARTKQPKNSRPFWK